MQLANTHRPRAPGRRGRASAAADRSAPARCSSARSPRRRPATTPPGRTTCCRPRAPRAFAAGCPRPISSASWRPAPEPRRARRPGAVDCRTRPRGGPAGPRRIHSRATAPKASVSHARLRQAAGAVRRAAAAPEREYGRLLSPRDRRAGDAPARSDQRLSAVLARRSRPARATSAFRRRGWR